MLYSEADGSTVEITEDMAADIADMEIAKESIKSATATKEECEARIRQAIGSATFAQGMGLAYSLKTITTKERTTHYPANSYRKLAKVKR
jgi:hypothetical protein